MTGVRPSSFTLCIRFGLVGGIGFVTESAILSLLVGREIAGPYAARCLSFPVAVTLTWALNRRITFAQRPIGGDARRYSLYVLGQAGSALVNLFVYATLMLLEPRLEEFPVLALAGGAAVGLICNFLWTNKIVFAGD